MSDHEPLPAALLDLAAEATTICVLTGAGMSAESGIPTFRDAQVGLWARFDPQELASPVAWEQDPAQVWAWYAWRAGLVQRASPNAGHRALANWQRRPGVHLQIATQNVDDLHERAGATVLAHVHGSLFALRCAVCAAPSPTAYPPVLEPVARLDPPVCRACTGRIRPGVVWFGEPLPEEEFRAAAVAAQQADLVIVVGTSGLVYPAAALPVLAAESGVPVVELNPHPSAVSEAATVTWRVPAAVGLPELVAALG